MRPIVILLTLLTIQQASGMVSGFGLVVTKVDSIYGMIKLDLKENRVTIKGPDNRYHSLVASQVNRVIIGKGFKQEQYASAVFGADSEIYFFRVLSEGKVSLYYREGVKFSRFDNTPFPPYYAFIGNALYSLGNKKECLAIFGLEEKNMRDFMKAKGLDYGDQRDLTMLFNHYNGVEGSQIFAFKD
ncbi:MAG: hypothetical protein AAGA85_22080 [Bacteroidota bacterium]